MRLRPGGLARVARRPDWRNAVARPRPSPRIEHADKLIRLWADGGEEATKAPSVRPVEIPVGDLVGILYSVRDAMHGFLSLTKQWATCHVPSLAMDLATKLDEDLAISAPLPSDYDQHVL